MIRKYSTDILVLLLIALSVFIFFAKLFFPVPQLLVTPDFGRSDAWHFSFATKYFLSESLKRGELPLWSNKLGGGFPLVAEGQTGTFYLPNLIFYRFLPVVTAYNLTLVLALVILGWGTYLFLRLLGVGKVNSLFAGFTMSFSGMTISQLTHVTLMQGFTLMPTVMAATLLLSKKKTFWRIALLSFLLSQQIFSGFPQAVFITVIFASMLEFYLFMKRKINYSDIFLFLLALALSAGLSAVQLLPSWEFLRFSAFPGGFSQDQATYFSYPFKHLITLLNPFLLGNPKLGTYPDFRSFNGSIFWENTGFIGILPLLAAGFVFFKSKKNFWLTFFLIALPVFLLLMTGSGSPLYFVYSFWPFNLFRAPSRFVWVFVFSLVVLGTFGLENFRKKIEKFNQKVQILLFAFLALNIIYLIKPWVDYHMYYPADNWLARPETVTNIKQDSRIYTLGNDLAYNKYFLKSGWKDPKPYLFLNNLLAPDSNLIWNISSAEVYAGRSLQRQSVISDLIDIGTTTSDKEATLSALTRKLLDLTSAETIVSSEKLDSSFKFVNNLVNNDQTINIYINEQSLPESYIVYENMVANTAEDAANLIASDSFVPGETTLLEKPLLLKKNSSQNKTQIKLLRPSDTETVIEVDANPEKGLLVLNDTYYPGWQAQIDNVPVPIYPANINFRAVEIPAGKHKVIFKFQPQSFVWGGMISLETLVLFLIAGVFFRFGAVFRTRRKVFEHF